MQRNVDSLKAVSLHKALTTHELILQKIQGLSCPNKSMPILLQCCDLLGLLWCVFVFVCLVWVGWGVGWGGESICNDLPSDSRLGVRPCRFQTGIQLL